MHSVGVGEGSGSSSPRRYAALARVDVYLWLVEHLFHGNELIDGRLVVDGRRADLANITCPLFLLAGARDHITPPPQLFAAATAVGTPPSDVVQRTAAGGHLGLFTGSRALEDDWPVLMADVFAHSTTGLARGA